MRCGITHGVTRVFFLNSFVAVGKFQVSGSYI